MTYNLFLALGLWENSVHEESKAQAVFLCGILELFLLQFLSQNLNPNNNENDLSDEDKLILPEQLDVIIFNFKFNYFGI